MKIIVYKDINWFEKTMECDLNGGFIEMEGVVCIYSL